MYAAQAHIGPMLHQALIVQNCQVYDSWHTTLRNVQFQPSLHTVLGGKSATGVLRDIDEYELVFASNKSPISGSQQQAKVFSNLAAIPVSATGSPEDARLEVQRSVRLMGASTHKLAHDPSSESAIGPGVTVAIDGAHMVKHTGRTPIKARQCVMWRAPRPDEIVDDKALGITYGLDKNDIPGLIRETGLKELIRTKEFADAASMPADFIFRLMRETLQLMNKYNGQGDDKQVTGFGENLTVADLKDIWEYLYGDLQVLPSKFVQYAKTIKLYDTTGNERTPKLEIEKNISNGTSAPTKLDNLMRGYQLRMQDHSKEVESSIMMERQVPYNMILNQQQARFRVGVALDDVSGGKDGSGKFRYIYTKMQVTASGV